MSFCAPEKFRIKSGALASDASFGNNGAFEVRLRHSQIVFVIASDQMGWEHVSVSRKDRCPTWEEMCQVRTLFWGEEDWVSQFHPPKDQYVNNHPYCLHLWRCVDAATPVPHSFMVGLRDVT